MNKLYFFSGPDADSGVFIGAKTWREARTRAMRHECMDYVEFIDIRGGMCKENGKPVHTEVTGELELHEILATGYTNFWWAGDCDKCGKYSDHLNPTIDGKLICLDCETPEDEVSV